MAKPLIQTVSLHEATVLATRALKQTVLADGRVLDACTRAAVRIAGVPDLRDVRLSASAAIGNTVVVRRLRITDGDDVREAFAAY